MVEASGLGLSISTIDLRSSSPCNAKSARPSNRSSTVVHPAEHDLEVSTA
jgi:hypothetical protein